jgi:hypothetical protein
LICEELRRLWVVVTPSAEMTLDFFELALLKLELLVNFPFASSFDLFVTAAAEAVSAENPSPCNLWADMVAVAEECCIVSFTRCVLDCDFTPLSFSATTPSCSNLAEFEAAKAEVESSVTWAFPLRSTLVLVDFLLLLDICDCVSVILLLELPEPKLLPAIAPMVGILAKGEAFVKLRPPLDMLDTMFGLVSPDFSLPSEPKSLVSGISIVPRGEVTVGMAEAVSLSSSMSTSPELKLGISSPLKPRAKTASAGLPVLLMDEREELKTEFRCSETRVDSLLMEVRFCISERLPFSSARLDLTSGFAS